MARSFISKRVVFPCGKQKEFLLNAKKMLNLSYTDLARQLKISNRTLTDWKREKFLMSLRAVKIISKRTNRKIPKNIEIKEPFWYVYKSAKIGATACFKKYGRIGGDPEYRKKKWHEWWEKEGRFKKHSIINIAEPVKKPCFSKELAEFVGIVLGDGGVTQRQITITLHSEDDREYSKFVVNLIKKLFNVSVGTYYRKDSKAVNYNISRTKLVRFCIEKVGLKQGNKIKQQVDIPNWIKGNKLYSIACVRGLIDTDGCIFTHCYKSKGKWYRYKKLSFTSYSKPLRQSVFDILKNNGLNPRFAQRKDVRLDCVKDVQKYFQLINSHNPKHLKKYSEKTY